MDSKNIKDYLHLYLGCQMLYSSHHEPQNETYTLTTLNLTEAIEFEDRPILRPLSDMTEEEGATIGKICYGPVDSIKWRIEHRQHFLKIYRNHYSKNITIDYMSGDIDHYDDDGVETSINQTETFRYMLSMGFDLFGLIEAGLAIKKSD